VSARITVDLDNVHPVFDGRWHRVWLTRMPAPGELIQTFCGRVEQAEYSERYDETVVPATCWTCDLVHRRQQGINVRPDHPGLGTAHTSPSP